ncbi:conserved hypothetical protein [Burkholderia latens]
MPPAAADQPPPLAPAGVDAVPGMLAAPPVVPLSAPAVPLLGMPEGAVDGAGDMPPVALVSELALVPVSFEVFLQPAPAARPAIRTPAKTARDT